MRCSVCGDEVERGLLFCPSCGSLVKKDSSSTGEQNDWDSGKTGSQEEFGEESKRRDSQESRFNNYHDAALDNRKETVRNDSASENNGFEIIKDNSGGYEQAAQKSSIMVPTKAIAACACVAVILIALFLVFGRGVSTKTGNGVNGDAGRQGSLTTAGQVNSTDANQIGTPERKASFNEYSWSEISSIAAIIEDAGSKGEALRIAADYNLTDNNGMLTGESKPLALKNGQTILVQIAGIYHDEKSDGTGKAALTFITLNSYTNHHMNTSDTNDGGWASSDMRSWLNNEIVNYFPDDVNPVYVSKLSNNTGVSTSSSVVTKTSDQLFLFTWRELLGPIDWGTTNDIVFNAEGEQYQLFSDMGVSGYQDNDPHQILYKRQGDSGGNHSVWWVRSAKPNEDDGFGDFDNGEADNGGKASLAQGTVFGFCL